MSLQDIQNLLLAVFKPDRYLFTRRVQIGFSGSLIKGVYAGTSANPPPGWTVTSPTTGKWTVVHNLGTTNYLVLATPLNGGVNTTYTLNCNNPTVTAFDLYFGIAGGGGNTVPFSFIVIAY